MNKTDQTPSPTVQADSYLTLHYRIGLPEGGNLVNTFEEKPATLLMGTGQFSPTLDDDYTPGDMIEFRAPNGATYSGMVMAVEDEAVLFDFNHPLSGKTIQFEVEIIGIL